MKMRPLGAVLVAAAALMLCASPARADYVVKDGNGAFQTMKSFISGLIHWPGHVMGGLFGGVPTAVNMTNTGAIDMTCVSGCSGSGSPMQQTGGTVGLVAGSADIGTIHLGSGSSFIGHVIVDTAPTTPVSIGQLPTSLGSTTKAASLSVALASDQTLPAFASPPTFNLGTLNGAATDASVTETHAAAGSTASKADEVQGCPTCTPVRIIGAATLASATFTTPAGTSNYTPTNNLIANSGTNTSVAPMTFTVCSVNQGTGMIRRGRFKTADTGFAGAVVTLKLYRDSPTTITNGDHAAWSTNESNYVGSITVSVNQTFTDAVKGIGAVDNGAEINFDCASGAQTLYGLETAATTITPQGAKAHTWVLEDLPN